MSTFGIKLRTTLVWAGAALAAAGPASPQNAPLRFDARLLPSHAPLAASIAMAPGSSWGIDPRLRRAGSALAAQDTAAPVPALRFNVTTAPAVAVLAGTIVLAMAPSVFASHLPYATCAPCDPSRLPGIDRGTVGPQQYGAATVSDAFLYSNLLMSGVAVLAESSGDHKIAREDFVVFAQSLATADLVTAWAKVLFHRPRPFRYLASAAGTGDDPKSGLSFPSGHSTAAWAAAFAYWSIQQRHGRARARAPIIATLVAASVMTAVMRVEAHQHFPTDVIAGAVIGAAVGWTVPRLYPSRR